jgi:hypothetical protein
VDVRVYLVGYIFCIISCHICRDIFDRIDITYCSLPYVSGGAQPVWRHQVKRRWPRAVDREVWELGDWQCFSMMGHIKDLLFEEWQPEEEGFPLPRVWIRIFRLPSKLREFSLLWALGSMLGATQSVDMVTSLRKNYGRVEVAVLNVRSSSKFD